MLKLVAIIVVDLLTISLGDIYMSKPKRIFIVGHMGAGKALLSEALAKKLGWQYIDAQS
jgi:tRNA A37 threonylcarbamoyladenosine biosynthesis protein TsaE